MYNPPRTLPTSIEISLAPPPGFYTCTPCNKTFPLAFKSTHDVSNKHLNSSVTCDLCHVSYALRNHDIHVAGRVHRSGGIAPGFGWERPQSGLKPTAVGKTPGLGNFVKQGVWNCKVCGAAMQASFKAAHQSGGCTRVQSGFRTRGNPVSAQTSADNKVKAKKGGFIASGRERKGDRAIWTKDDYDDYGDYGDYVDDYY